MSYKKAAVLLFLIAILLSYLPFIDNSPVIGGQQSTFMLLGKSLESGQGYRELWLNKSEAHGKFPFIYPITLTPIIHFFGYNFLMMRLLNLLFLLLALWAIYLLFIREEGMAITLSIMALTAFSYELVYCLTNIYSDMCYFAFSLFGIVLAKRYFESREESFLKFIPFALCVLCAYFTRTIGVSLVLSAVFYQLFIHRRYGGKAVEAKKIILAVFIFLLPVITWELRRCLINSGISNEYTVDILRGLRNPLSFDKTSGFLGLVAHNLYAYLFYQIPFVISGYLAPSFGVAGLLISVLVLLGVLRQFFKKSLGVIECYLLFYLFFLSIYHGGAIAKRYFIPISPFLIYYFIEGIRCFSFHCDVRKPIFILLPIIILFKFSGAVIGIGHNEDKISGAASLNDYFSAVDWIKNNTKASSIFLTVYPDDLFLYTGRKAVGSGYLLGVKDELRDIEYIRKNKCDYILVSSPDAYYANLPGLYLRLIGRMPSENIRRALVYRHNSAEIYQLSR